VSDLYCVGLVAMFPVIDGLIGFFYLGILYLRGWIGQHAKQFVKFNFTPEEGQ
jgi:hypothetical protein